MSNLPKTPAAKQPLTPRAKRKQAAATFLRYYTEVEAFVHSDAIVTAPHAIPHAGPYLCNVISTVPTTSKQFAEEQAVWDYLRIAIENSIKIDANYVGLVLPAWHYTNNQGYGSLEYLREATSIRASLLQFLLLDYIDNGLCVDSYLALLEAKQTARNMADIAEYNRNQSN